MRTSLPSTARGTCYGFQVHADANLSFHYLRSGDGLPLDVTAPAQASGPGAQLVREWSPQAGHNFTARLYREGDAYYLWFDGDTWFTVEPDIPRIVLPKATDTVLREEMLWMIPAGMCILQRGYLPVHAAAVQVDNKAILFAAPGGFGKTTLAAAFHGAGFRVLSEDITCVSLEQEFSVIPGPAMLRIRPDVIDRLHLPLTEVVRRTESRVSLALDATSRGTCDPVAIHEILLLRSSAEWKTEIVKPQDAIPDLWILTQRLHRHAEAGISESFKNVAALANRVPILNFYRPFELNALQRTVEAILRTC